MSMVKLRAKWIKDESTVVNLPSRGEIIVLSLGPSPKDINTPKINYWMTFEGIILDVTCSINTHQKRVKLSLPFPLFDSLFPIPFLDFDLSIKGAFLGRNA